MKCEQSGLQSATHGAGSQPRRARCSTQGQCTRCAASGRVVRFVQHAVLRRMQRARERFVWRQCSRRVPQGGHMISCREAAALQKVAVSGVLLSDVAAGIR